MSSLLPDPTREYCVVGLLLLLGVSASLLAGFRRWFDAGAAALARGLRRHHLFEVADPLTTQRRLDTFRMVLALAALYRCSDNLNSCLSNGGPMLVAFLVTSGLSLLLLVGLLTPLAALTLILVQNLYVVPNVYHIFNLPSVVLVVGLFPLALTPAGRSRSLDAWLMRRGGRVGSALTRLYSIWGDFHPDRYTLGLFASLMGYWLVCISACLNHLEDPNWRSGILNAWLLLSPSINRDYHWVFDWGYSAWPGGFVMFAVVSTWGMLVWELVLFPCVLWRWTRWVVVAWGAMFFFMSWFILRLKCLVVAEMAVWFLLFWPLRAHWTSFLPFGGRRPEPAAEEPAPTPAAPTGWLFRGWVVSFVALALAFLPTMPIFRDWKPIRKLHARSVKHLRHAPFAYGLTQVLVFDSRFESYHRFIHLSMKPDEVHSPDTAESYRLRGWFCPHKPDPNLIRLGMTPDLWDGLRRVVRLKPSQEPATVQVRMQLGPTADELWRWEYVPQRSVVICEASLCPQTNAVLASRVTPEGLEVILKPYALPGPIDPADADILLGHPDAEELKRIEYWYFKSGKVAQTAANRLAMDRLHQVLTRHPTTLTLIPAIRDVVAQLGLDWDETGCPPPDGADPAADLELARAYFRAAYDDDLRKAHGGAMAAAEEAYRQGDARRCLLHCAAVRRGYFGQLFRPQP